MGGTGQMNFLIHMIGSATDFDSWQVSGWDSYSLKSTFDRLSCWMDTDKPTGRPFELPKTDMCTADFLHHEGIQKCFKNTFQSALKICSQYKTLTYYIN